MYKFTEGILPLVMEITKLPIFYDYYFSEFNSDSCFKVLYMKNDKFATKQVYVQDIKKKKKKNYPRPKTLHRHACDACDTFHVCVTRV